MQRMITGSMPKYVKFEPPEAGAPLMTPQLPVVDDRSLAMELCLVLKPKQRCRRMLQSRDGARAEQSSKRAREQLVQRRDDRVALGNKGANVLAKLLIGNRDDFERVKDDADVLDLV